MLISIILPIRNEGNYLKECLDSIFAQNDSGFALELIIADGLSTDGSKEIIFNYRESHPSIIILDNPKEIVPSGMNLALRQAKGDILIRVDGHCIINSDYVSNCVRHLTEDGYDGVGGPMETIGETYISEAIAVAMSSQFGVGNSAFRTTSSDKQLVDTIPFPAYTRAIFEKAGYYDEELVRNQDDEYNYRIRELGGKLLLANDVGSKYYSRGSLGKLWKQYFQYGYWKVRVLQKHPKQMSLRQFIPPAFVLSLLISLILTITTTWGVWLLVLAAGSYLIANLLASIITSAKKGWRHLLLLPVTFGIIHFSYGSGFLIGLLKFWNRWGDKVGKVPQA